MTYQNAGVESNPFSVKTPENLTAEELVDLFVPNTAYKSLRETGHQFLNGHRGSGKSMMLKMMSPDSQILYNRCSLEELPYFGVYLSIKATEINAPEFTRLEKETSGTVLSEHVLTTKLLSSLFTTIRDQCSKEIQKNEFADRLRDFAIEDLFKKLSYSGWVENLPQAGDTRLSDADSILKFVIDLIDQVHSQSLQFIKRRSFANESLPYQGVLIGFQDVLLPIASKLSKSGIIPKDRPIFFLLDDADNLTLQQTQILNTWVSFRTTDVISLKISTQLNYKTFKTTSGVKIEAPHDFSALNFTSVYTGPAKDKYPELVASIVKKRLARYGSAITDAYEFFPQDVKQTEEIRKIEQEIKDRWVPGQSGSRPEDDSYRYARPEFIRRMAETRQGAHYKYAGFEQLVHVSSGIIRFFLEPASKMFAEQQQQNNSQNVSFIDPAVQDRELRKQADELLLTDLDELAEEAERNKDPKAELNDIERLRNVVKGVGALFKSHIMDEKASQRRVFSFQIAGEASQELKSLLKLGVIHGYFYIDSIGKKDGLGRAKLYVLSRRLAPAFSLDPIGFSSYLSITAEQLLDISKSPGAYISRLRKFRSTPESAHPDQLPLLGDDSNE